MRLRIALVAVVGVALLAPPALAESRNDLFLRGFDEMALWRDNKYPVATRKWRYPLRVRIFGAMAASYESLVMDNLNRISSLTGLTILRVEKGENFLVEFSESSGYVVGGRTGACVTTTQANSSGELVSAKLSISLQTGSGLRNCVIHELMHAVGFPGHPHGLNTVLSYVSRPTALTDIDEMALRVLYDERMATGANHLTALTTARQILMERLGIHDDTFGRKHLKAAYGYLAEAASRGDAGARAQLEAWKP